MIQILKYMQFAIGSDHAGFSLKSKIIDAFPNSLDVGTCSENASVDYPDFAESVVHKIKSKQAEFGVLICKTGIGMSIAANVLGVRSALCVNTATAELARKHNDARILCIGAMNCAAQEAVRMVQAFIATKFDNDRHINRINKINNFGI